MGAMDPSSLEAGTFGYYTIKDRAPHYAVVDTPGGTMYGAHRPAEPGITYWRIAHVLMPCHALIPTGDPLQAILERPTAVIRVPIVRDDDQVAVEAQA